MNIALRGMRCVIRQITNKSLSRIMTSPGLITATQRVDNGHGALLPTHVYFRFDELERVYVDSMRSSSYDNEGCAQKALVVNIGAAAWVVRYNCRRMYFDWRGTDM